jgi:hypothetical protein
VIGAPATGEATAAGGVDGGASPAGGSGVDAQPASVPTIANHAKDRFMLLILLEALLALGVLVFIVWWTMFSGRKKGEPPRDEQAGREDKRR